MNRRLRIRGEVIDSTADSLHLRVYGKKFWVPRSCADEVGAGTLTIPERSFQKHRLLGWVKRGHDERKAALMKMRGL